MKFIFSVCQFGDMSISKMKVGDFQGDSGKPSSSNQIGILELLGTNSQLFDLKSNIEAFPRIFDHGCGRNNSGIAIFIQILNNTVRKLQKIIPLSFFGPNFV